MKEFLFIRHGESEYNRRTTKNLDSPLTDKGRWQAEQLGKFLKENFKAMTRDGAYTGLVSPYLRCLETAHIIGMETGLRFTVDPGPIEIRVFYDWTDVAYRMEEYGHFSWELVKGPLRLHKETMKEFMERMRKYVRSFNEGRYVVVSHGTPCDMMIEMACGLDHEPDSFDLIKNCSLSWVVDGVKDPEWYNRVVYGDFSET